MADPIEQNIQGVQQLVGSKLNKSLTTATSTVEGVEGEHEDEFTLELTDEELIHLANTWENNYRGYEAKIKARQDAVKAYYLGRQKEGGSMVTTEGQPISANLLFEAEETFLPSALAKNPEPVVWSDNSPEGNELSKQVKTMLQYHADTLALRRKLTLAVRHWSIYFIGVLKHGWDDEIKDIKTEVRDPRNFIFDPDGYIDPYADYEGPLGERITIRADKLIKLFPKHKDYITILVDGKLGTDIVYTEWWNDDYVFYTFKGKVLDKNKNPHFNYAKKTVQPDIDGVAQVVEMPGSNHFAKPKKPYTFLTVFSLGEQPHDVTGLIEQNIPNQRRISRRTEQIDFNLTRQNNSDIFSGNNFNQETAKQAAQAIAKGHPVIVPAGGPINDAVHRLQAQGIDGAFFKELETSKNDLRSIFGTQGITATENDDDQTARGMILNNQYDNSRIGGGIGDAIEQVADNVFNWWVQLYHVYYDEQHFAIIMGQMKAVEYKELKMQDLNRRLIVSVTADSMKAHDELTEMRQAMELYEKGALDPKTLLTMLNVPDPQKTAESTVLWIVDKGAYMQLNFPELAQKMAQLQQEQQQAMMAQQQQQAQLQEQQVQQGMAQKQAQVDQQLQQKEQTHQQKLAHGEQAFTQKQKQSLAQDKASASLSKVKLPK